MYGFAVSFSPPNASWPIQRVRIYGWTFGKVSESQRFELEIWSANLTTLFTASIRSDRFGSGVSWVNFDIPGPTVSGRFYVVFYPGGTSQAGVQLGIDTSLPNTHSEIVSGKRILTDWAEAKFNPPLKKEQTNWMIRVVGGGGTLPYSSATTAISITSTTSGTTIFGINISTLQGIAGAAGTGVAGFAGWFFKTKKRRFVSTYLMKVDSTYNEFFMNREECKKRLSEMKQQSIELLRKGKIDEPHFTLVDNKLTQYLKDLG